MVKGDSDSDDENHVAIDDGTRDKAWDLSIGTERYRRLPPGTFVHVRVNLVEGRLRELTRRIDFNQY
ncbi:MAG: hypothetical protein ACRDPF_13050 [Streptosporangiaceae bacterium]